MDLTIESVDYAPADLYDQQPFSASLLRQLAGPDQPDYWLAALHQPLSWSKAGQQHEITHLVLAARWEGTKIAAGATNLPVGIAYVTDATLLDDARLDFRKCEYVAIGIASDSTNGRRTRPLTEIISGTIARLFGLGGQ